MENRCRPRPHFELQTFFFWTYLLLICLTLGPMFAGLIGLISVFSGMLLGELAAVLLLVLFFVDILLRIRRALEMDTYDEDPWQDDWEAD